MKHILHFANNEEMSYCLSHLDCFVQPVTSNENEFDGDAPNEVTFTTGKLISKTVIARMTKHFEPKDSLFNQTA